tara:strand:- start:3980 stop:4885 length:906 start_codon:yes stop_codon:yes gene_type:complete
MSLQRKNKMHMIDVMSKLKEIAESGYDNEDIQRGIDAAATHVFVEDETMEGKSQGKAWYREQEAQEMAKKDGKDWSRMTYGDKEDYRAKVKAKYEDTTTESDENDILEDADIEEVHEAVEEDHDELADILKLAGKSGVIGMAKPQTIIAEDIELEEEEIEETDYDTTANEDSAEAETAISEEEIEKVLNDELEEEAVEETVEVPVTALADLMKLAGYSDYQEQVEEYANEPTQEYMDAEEQLIGLSGGMNGPKKAYAAAAGGDNAMAQEPREIEESDVDLETTFESFYKKYDAFVEDLKSE